MKFKLPPSLYAPEQLTAVRYELTTYAEWLSNSQVRARTGATGVEEPALSDDTIALLKLWQEGEPISPRSLSELEGTLAKLVLPVIHIMLAANPAVSFRQELVKWFRELGGSDYLISISVNRTIGGGMIIRTPNHYYDWSYGRRVIEHKDKLPDIVRKFCRSSGLRQQHQPAR